ncbi:MAG: hypothetical protein ACYDHX_08660 [Methanothrix sp.]
MLSAKYAALALGVMFIALAFNASAQWSPGGSMVYMGDLNLAAFSASSGKAVQALGGSQEIQAATNNSSMSNSSLNNSSINATSMDNSTAVSPAAVLPSAGAAESSGKEILDLSSYSRDRANKNLAGYKNIMYPISGSRGTTTSTAGGGGSCGCS